MNQELVKQLKDVGFQQKGRGQITFGDIRPGKYGQTGYIPTLSELIKACGESFNSLAYVRKDGLPVSSMIDGEMTWEASCWERSVQGDTPEEAVAKLWLELNLTKSKK